MAKNKRNAGNSKGADLEELLRCYFVKLGSFCVRSIPCQHQGIDLTDIDVWTYSRTSALSRHRSNVDIKNKARPQAVERIFWALGLKETFSLDEAIVATTDKRCELQSLSKKAGVRLLDGTFLSRLSTSAQWLHDLNRLTEEQFCEKAFGSQEHSEVEKSCALYSTAKSRLLTSIGFTSANYNLAQIGPILEAISLGTSRRDALLRQLYIYIAFFLISIDYSMKDIALLPDQERADEICAGFKYGAMGRSGMEDLASKVEMMLRQNLPNGEVIWTQLREKMGQVYERSEFDILSAFFCKSSVSRTLFDLATQFESCAFRQGPTEDPSSLRAEMMSILGLLCDSLSVDRTKVI